MEIDKARDQDGPASGGPGMGSGDNPNVVTPPGQASSGPMSLAAFYREREKLINRVGRKPSQVPPLRSMPSIWDKSDIKEIPYAFELMTLRPCHRVQGVPFRPTSVTPNPTTSATIRPEMTLGKFQTLANRAFIMDRDALMVGEVETYSEMTVASTAARNILNWTSRRRSAATPWQPPNREQDLGNTPNRSFMEERTWTRGAFMYLYSALISLFNDRLQRNGVFQFTAVCTPKTIGERLKTYLFRIFYITYMFVANITRRVDDVYRGWAAADELSTFGETTEGIAKKARSATAPSMNTNPLTFVVFIVLDLTDFSNTALVEEGLFTAYHHLATGNASSAIEAVLFTRNTLSPIWGLLKDLHLLLMAVCGEHEGTLVAKMQKSTRGLATILIIALVHEQPLLVHGIRIKYVGGGVQSDDGGFSIECVIEDVKKVPSARVIRGVLMECLSRYSTVVPCKVNLIKSDLSWTSYQVGDTRIISASYPCTSGCGSSVTSAYVRTLFESDTVQASRAAVGMGHPMTAEIGDCVEAAAQIEAFLALKHCWQFPRASGFAIYEASRGPAVLGGGSALSPECFIQAAHGESFTYSFDRHMRRLRAGRVEGLLKDRESLRAWHLILGIVTRSGGEGLGSGNCPSWVTLTTPRFRAGQTVVAKVEAAGNPVDEKTHRILIGEPPPRLDTVEMSLKSFFPGLPFSLTTLFKELSPQSFYITIKSACMTLGRKFYSTVTDPSIRNHEAVARLTHGQLIYMLDVARIVVHRGEVFATAVLHEIMGGVSAQVAIDRVAEKFTARDAEASKVPRAGRQVHHVPRLPVILEDEN